MLPNDVEGACCIAATECVAKPSAELNAPCAAAVKCAGAGRLPFALQQVLIGTPQCGAIAVAIRVLLHCIEALRSLVAVIGDPGIAFHVLHDYRIVTQ